MMGGGGSRGAEDPKAQGMVNRRCYEGNALAIHTAEESASCMAFQESGSTVSIATSTFTSQQKNKKTKKNTTCGQPRKRNRPANACSSLSLALLPSLLLEQTDRSIDR